MLSKHKTLLFSLLFILTYAGVVTFAVPPLTQYTPGETLDPSCAPGDVNCSVEMASFSGWGLTGNAGTDLSANFIGTTDSQPLIFRTNNVEHMRIAPDGKVAIGTTSTSATLTVNEIDDLGAPAPELITNGTFTGSAAGWNVSECASYNNNAIDVYYDGNCSYVDLTTNVEVESGKSYTLTFTISNATDEAVFYLNNIFTSYNSGPFGNGAHSVTIESDYTGTETIYFDQYNYNYESGYTLDNVTLVEINTTPVKTLALDVIGNTRLSGVDRYLNFGTTSGSNGYGFRDNAGVMQFKNNIGTWSSIPNPGWGLTGNSGTDSSINFIGTTDDQDVVIRRANIEVGRFHGHGVSFGAGSGRVAYSNFIGIDAGNGVIDAFYSNFLGTQAGQNATNASSSNFFGQNAGNGSTNAYNSNFFGSTSGYDADNSHNSNFIGNSAGWRAINSHNSNFLGNQAGFSADDAHYSNFFGYHAGYQADNSDYSNFFGYEAGLDAINSSYSNLFGYRVGYNPGSGNSIGSNNIIIGTNISLPSGASNSMNLGGILFGINTHSTVGFNASWNAVSSGRIGVATNTLNYTFQAGNSSVSGIVARFQNSTGTCDINPTTTALTCSSDQTLKSNIVSLDSALSSITALRPVNYSWTSDSSSTPQVGFIAQEVESIFPSLVSTDPTTGLKSLASTNLIPYTIKALQDMNTSLIMLDDMQTPNLFRDALTRFLESATNGLQRIFAKEVKTEKLCIGTDANEVCIDQDQLRNLLENQVPQVIMVPVETQKIKAEKEIEEEVRIQEEGFDESHAEEIVSETPVEEVVETVGEITTE